MDIAVLPEWFRRGYQIQWDQNYRKLCYTIWVLDIKPRSSGRVAGVLNCWATAPAATISWLSMSCSWDVISTQWQSPFLVCGSESWWMYIIHLGPRVCSLSSLTHPSWWSWIWAPTWDFTSSRIPYVFYKQNGLINGTWWNVLIKISDEAAL